MLHRLELPPEAERLRWVVGLQERLLRGLCEGPTTPATVSVAWVQALWRDASSDWVSRFCTRRVAGQTALELMQVIAGATSVEKAAVLRGHRNDCRCEMAFRAKARRFRLSALGCCGGNRTLAEAVKVLFLRFYDPEFNAGQGFAAPGAGGGNPTLDRTTFVAAWVRHNDLGVCPYCDGPLVRTRAKVDHFYPKSQYPFLAITPENLVPVCTDCNSLQVKGAHVPLALGAANEVVDWFHPYHRTADGQFRVKFLSPRENDEPRQLWLACEDAASQRRADNLDSLLGVTRLWADRLKHRMTVRINALRVRRRKRGHSLSDDELREECREWADDAWAGRRHAEFAILDEAWCRAAAAGDTQFLDELATVNTERL